MSTAKDIESYDDEAIEAPLGRYKGYPIVGVKLEWRGISGGLTKAVGVAPVITEPAEPVFIMAKGLKESEDHDFIRDDNGKITGVVLIQVYKHLGVAFADEEKAGEAVHEMMEKVALAEALRKEGQQAFTISEDDPTLTVVELNDLRKALTASGVPDSEDDRQAYITRVLGEMPSALHQSHQETILTDLQEQLDAEREDDNEPGEHSEEHAMKGKVNEIFQPPNLASVPSEDA